MNTRSISDDKTLNHDDKVSQDEQFCAVTEYTLPPFHVSIMSRCDIRLIKTSVSNGYNQLTNWWYVYNCLTFE